MSLHIGIDLDNTIINYDAAFGAAAAKLGIDDGVGGKKAVRDRVRLLEDGEARWTRLQADVYGPGIGAAVLFAGVDAFIARAQARGILLSIVSHKSVFAAATPNGTNLRECATAFLRERGITLPVHFASTREEKLGQIAAVGATHFIDDLVEVFRDPAFPPGVERWLFAPHGAPLTGASRVFASWDELTRALDA